MTQRGTTRTRGAPWTYALILTLAFDLLLGAKAQADSTNHDRELLAFLSQYEPSLAAWPTVRARLTTPETELARIAADPALRSVVRIRAIDLLGLSPESKTALAAVRRASTDKGTYVRRAALLTLASRFAAHLTGADRVVIRTAAATPQHQLQVVAVRALALLEDPTSAELLRRLARTSSDASIRELAARLVPIGPSSGLTAPGSRK
ncbi:MAG: hypothetical protein R3A78_09800 [Polyangiales bacterium]|nr:hypothetical protein [Myxococcales bacterium]